MLQDQCFPSFAKNAELSTQHAQIDCEFGKIVKCKMSGHSQHSQVVWNAFHKKTILPRFCGPRLCLKRGTVLATGTAGMCSQMASSVSGFPDMQQLSTAAVTFFNLNLFLKTSVTQCWLQARKFQAFFLYSMTKAISSSKTCNCFSSPKFAALMMNNLPAIGFDRRKLWNDPGRFYWLSTKKKVFLY